jgi:hypothetical protein
MSELTIYPNADSTDGAWAPQTGTDLYTNIDEVSGGSDFASLVSTQSRDSTFLCGYQDPAGSGTINKITIWANASISLNFGGPTFGFYLTVKSSSTQQDSAAKTLTGSDTDFSAEWATNPATGVAWTWDEINSLTAGCHGTISGGSIGSINVNRMKIVVDYTPTASGNPYYAYAQQ